MPTVIITGASGNLGTVVTQSLLKNDCKVIATVHNDVSAKELGTSAQLQTEILDLRNESVTADFVHKAISDHHTIDAAVLLAGGFAMGSIAETSTEAIRNQVSLNFETAYNIIRPLFQYMLEQGSGKIIVVGARPALQASAGKGMIAYSLSKSLLFKLAELLNAEAKGKNVTVSVIVPSTIDTKPNRESMPDANFHNWVKPEQIADLINYILSEKASMLREPIYKVYQNA